MPPTSNLIQGRLGLKKDLLCLDLNQGCAGFLIGLIQAFALLELEGVNRVVLINADALSPRVSVRDKNSYPLIGDAAAITIVERDPSAPVIHATSKMDGAAAKALIIPAGGFRRPSTPETAIQADVGDNNYRSLDDLTMDGTAVFNFVQQEVPPMIEELLSFAGCPRDAIEYYLFHQPNKFMLQKLAERLGVPLYRMPSNIFEHFGNASGVTVPTNIAFNLGKRLLDSTFQVCLAGFGAGLTWSSMLMRLGKLDFCEMMDF
jgi:3-oxoacyl-[acyl-carrier-protein] synthase III